MKYLAIILGGSIGAVLRYHISLLPYKYINTSFPLGTMFVNFLGSLLIGILWSLNENMNFTPNMRALIFTGLLGAFTTFSTYSLESFKLLQMGETKQGLLNIILTPLLSLFAVFLGYILVRIFVYIKM